MIPGGLILIGIHNDKALKLHALEPNICEVIADKDIPTRQFDDVEGMALPTKACMEYSVFAFNALQRYSVLY